MNTAPVKSKDSKTSKSTKDAPRRARTPLDKKIASALRVLKHDIVMIGRTSLYGEPVIFELSEMKSMAIDKLLLQALRELLE